MYYNMVEEEIRSLCRSNLESLEKWARIIIDRELSSKYGQDYFEAESANGEKIIKVAIRAKATEMMESNSTRFKRKVDTLYLDEIIYLLCKKELYNDCFKKILDYMYPNGSNEVQTFLNRLVPIRNKLSHSNVFSIREAEQCVCYCQDFIDGVKKYFLSTGEQAMYNTPNAIKINDSFGNEFYLNKDTAFEIIDVTDSTTGKLRQLSVGEQYSTWLTLDPSFPRNSYTIEWSIPSLKQLSDTEKLYISIEEEHIREKLLIFCIIRSKEKWHRYDGYDQQFAIALQVIPPIH